MADCSGPKPRKIVFFGDSITELGVQPDGYVTLIAREIRQQFPKRDINIIGAGISGNKVPDLQARLEQDVLSIKPDIVIIYIGINDVWHSILPGHTGTSPENFRSGLLQLIRRLQDGGVQIVLCTPSVIGEKRDNQNPLDPPLDRYADIIRQLAATENLPLIDLRRQFKAYLSANNPENLEQNILTYDGVHLNRRGNQFVAAVMLKTLTGILH
ncbi:MAG: SGNH/GDSL hydrolase family protein [Fidelibacterota bacterium]